MIKEGDDTMETTLNFRIKSLGILIISSIMIAGCAVKPATYLRPRVSAEDNHRVKVALIPLVNLTTERDAEKKVTYAFITHLLSSHQFEVLEMGEMLKALKEAKLRPDEDLSIENIKKIGKAAGVDVLLMGAVEEYKIDSSTLLGEKIFVPEVSIIVRMVSTKDGSIMWSANHHRRGDDRMTIFGMGRIDSISELTDVILKDTISSLAATLKQRESAYDLFKNGELKQTPEDPQQIEALKKENEKLSQEIAALKKQIEETQKAPAAQNSSSQEQAPENPAAQETVLGENKAAPSAPEDPKQKAKAQYKEAFEEIKKQYP